MAATEFKIVSWSPGDPVTVDKMNAMVSNDTYLRNSMLRGRYSAHSISRDEGVRLAGGLILVPASKSADATRSVRFQGFFSPGCRPIVTTGIISNGQKKINVVVNGPGNSLHPQREGFNVDVSIEADKKENRKIKRNFYVSWLALGY